MRAGKGWGMARLEVLSRFRRAEESSITSIAHKINKGEIPNIPAPDGQTKADAYFLKADSVEDAAKLIERLVVEHDAREEHEPLAPGTVASSGRHPLQVVACALGTLRPLSVVKTTLADGRD